MNNDLNDILDQAKLAKKPFKMPEGYLDTLNARIMQNVMAQASAETKPAVAPKAKRIVMTPLRWAAACVCALFIGTSIYFFTGNEESDKLVAESTTPQKDTSAFIKQALSSASETITAKVEEKVSQKAAEASNAESVTPENTTQSSAKTIAQNTRPQKSVNTATEGTAYEEAADYAMLDNYEMYDLMSEE